MKFEELLEAYQWKERPEFLKALKRASRPSVVKLIEYIEKSRDEAIFKRNSIQNSFGSQAMKASVLDKSIETIYRTSSTFLETKEYETGLRVIHRLSWDTWSSGAVKLAKGLPVDEEGL